MKSGTLLLNLSEWMGVRLIDGGEKSQLSVNVSRCVPMKQNMRCNSDPARVQFCCSISMMTSRCVSMCPSQHEWIQINCHSILATKGTKIGLNTFLSNTEHFHFIPCHLIASASTFIMPVGVAFVPLQEKAVFVLLSGLWPCVLGHSETVLMLAVFLHLFTPC